MVTSTKFTPFFLDLKNMMTIKYNLRLWLPEFLNLWTAFNMRHFWETHLINLFARTATDTMGEFDWNPYIPYVNNYLCISFLNFNFFKIIFMFERYSVIF